MTTPMNRGAFNELLEPGLAEVITDKFKNASQVYTQYMGLKDSTMKKETILQVEGFGAAAVKQEGGDIDFKSITQGWNQVFTHVNWGVGTRVTEEMYDDDLYNVFKDKLAGFMTRAVTQRRDLTAANVLINGFTAAYTGAGQTGTDAKALISNDHPFKSGGTFSNYLATPADLAQSSVKDMVTLLTRTKEAGDVPVVMTPKILVVAPENEFTAKEVLKSTHVPGSGNNDINSVQNIVSKVVVNPFLTDEDAWFIISDVNPLVFWTRKKPTLTSDNDFPTGDALMKLSTRISAGYDGPMGIVGSEGA